MKQAHPKAWRMACRKTQFRMDWEQEGKQELETLFKTGFMSCVDPIKSHEEIGIISTAEAEALKKMLMKTRNDPSVVQKARPLVVDEEEKKTTTSSSAWGAYKPVHAKAESNVSFVE